MLLLCTFGVFTHAKIAFRPYPPFFASIVFQDPPLYTYRHGRRPGIHAQFVVDISQMGFDRAFGDAQPQGDFLVPVAASHCRQHLQLPLRQNVLLVRLWWKRGFLLLAGIGHHPFHDFRLEQRLASRRGHPALALLAFLPYAAAILLL